MCESMKDLRSSQNFEDGGSPILQLHILQTLVREGTEKAFQISGQRTAD